MTMPGRDLIVLVDMDCVLCDFEEHALREYRRAYPDEPYVDQSKRRKQFISEDYRKLRPGLEEKMNEVVYSKDFFGTLPPINGAIEAVKEMQEMKHVDVYICTSLPPYYKHACVEKYEWVEKYFGETWVKRVIFARDKTLVNGDILIDDKPTIIKEGAVKPSWKQVLFTACHNKHVSLEDAGCIARLESWTPHSHWEQLLQRHLQP